MKRGGLFYLVASIAGGLACAPALAQQVLPPQVNPGTIQQENFRNQIGVETRIQPRQSDTPSVVSPKRPPPVVIPSGGPTFILGRVEFTPSAFLSQAELDALVEPLIGRPVTIGELQGIVNAVDALYADKGIVTASATLPPQSATNGIIKIQLVEGRVGRVTTQQETVRPIDYLRERAGLVSGEVANVPELVQRLDLYNRTSETQIRTLLQPGADFGQTDIILDVTEPKSDLLQVFGDNYGSDSVGKLEGGALFRRFGIFGFDDRLTLYGVGARGNLSGSASYSVPILDTNGRLGFSYSVGQIRIVNGPFRPLDVEGGSQTFAVNATQPLFSSSKFLVLGNLGASYSGSQSDQSGFRITDDRTAKGTLGLTASYFGEEGTVTLSPSYSRGVSDLRVVDRRDNFHLFNLTAQASARLPMDIVFVFQGAGQMSSEKLLPGDQLFQIGGATSIRGYRSNLIAGDSGYYGNFELHHGLGDIVKGLDGFVFVDHGGVFSTSPKFQSLTSVGLGLSYTFNDRVTSDISIGFPLADQIDRKQDYMVSGRIMMTVF